MSLPGQNADGGEPVRGSRDDSWVYARKSDQKFTITINP